MRYDIIAKAVVLNGPDKVCLRGLSYEQSSRLADAICKEALHAGCTKHVGPALGILWDQMRPKANGAPDGKDRADAS